MTVLTGVHDEVRGERIVCFLRRIRSKRVIVGTARHRQMELVIQGTPARCRILKPLRSL